jgi:pimeloyl-ACP methyl ester carboxylesterase
MVALLAAAGAVFDDLRVEHMKEPTSKGKPAGRTRVQKLRRVALAGAGTLVGSALTLVGLLWTWSPGRPRPFLDAAGRILTGSMAEKLRVNINGVEQGMFIKGRDRSNPVLLWVHGGPGMPDYFLLEQYPTGLEELFTVVWWDQRGTALSYRPDIPPATMTVEQFIADTLAVTDYLRERFDQDKIYLLGHSWGSFIGIQVAARAPERYHAYIGMAQMVHQLRSEQLAYDYMLAAYRDRGEMAMVRALEKAPVSMADGTPQAYLAVRDKAMHRLGIGTTHDMGSVVTGIFLPSWSFPEYTVGEKLGLWRGRAFSRSFGLWEQIIRVDLTTTVPNLELPVYFFAGAYDYTCSYTLAEEYFRTLRAPLKGFYRFDGSAHSPILEQPELTREILTTDVLAGTNSRSSLN